MSNHDVFAASNLLEKRIKKIMEENSTVVQKTGYTLVKTRTEQFLDYDSESRCIAAADGRYFAFSWVYNNGSITIKPIN